MFIACEEASADDEEKFVDVEEVKIKSENKKELETEDEGDNEDKEAKGKNNKKDDHVPSSFNAIFVLLLTV